MRIALGSDHAGFALKEALKASLSAEHRDVLDVGTNSTDPVDRALRAHIITNVATGLSTLQAGLAGLRC